MRARGWPGLALGAAVAVAVMAGSAGAEDEQDKIDKAVKKALKQAVGTCQAWLRARHPDRLFSKGTSRPAQEELRGRAAVSALLLVGSDEYRRAVKPSELMSALEADRLTWLEQPVGVDWFEIQDAVALRDAVEMTIRVRFFTGGREETTIRQTFVKQDKRWVLPLRPPPPLFARGRLAFYGPVESDDVLDPGGGRSALAMARAAEALAAQGLSREELLEGLGDDAAVADFAVVESVSPSSDPAQMRVVLRCGIVRLETVLPAAAVAEHAPGERVLVRGTLSAWGGWGRSVSEPEGRKITWRHVTLHLEGAELFES